MQEKKERVFKGIQASSGIAIGKAFLLERETDLYIPLRKITKENVRKEVTKYKNALEMTKRELFFAKDKLLKALGKQHALLADAYISIIDDPLLNRDVIRTIEEDLVSTEYAVSIALSKVIQSFEKIEDEYFRGRISDIRDVSRKLIRNIIGKERKDLSSVAPNDIVVAHTLSPSDTVTIKERHCAGFAVDIGTKTSHISLVAQGLQIPAVVGLKNVTQMIEDGADIIVDGYEGIVIVNPEPQTIERYKKKYENITKEKEYLAKLKDLPCETVDGVKVKLFCNLDTHEEVDEALNVGADGIGLFRTEFQYLDRKDLPTEDELFEVYSNVVRKMSPKIVIFRTMDLGGDKLSKLGLEGIAPEASPALGLRGIRISLKYKDLFKTQLRAILRSSIYGNAKIMFPLISGIQDFRSAKAIVQEVKEDLKNKSVRFDEKIELGAMIELPSAALTSDLIAKEADFLSIGTNDLIQYTLAIDRMNENVAEMYETLHLSIIRLIKTIIDAGCANGKEVSMCGEMASEPAFTKLLLGMGLVNFSIPPSLVLSLKKLIRGLSFSESKDLIRQIFETQNIEKVSQIIKDISS